MSKYFKVTAVLKTNLTPSEQKNVLEYIEEWREKFEMKLSEDENVFVTNDDKIEYESQFAPAIFFYDKLRRQKHFFTKLMYEDLIEVVTKTAV